MTRYADFHARSLRDPQGFWAEQAALIDWQRPFDRVLDYENRRFRAGSSAARPTCATTRSIAMWLSAPTRTR